MKILRKRPAKVSDKEILQRLQVLPIKHAPHSIQRLYEREILITSVDKMLRGQTTERFLVPSKDQFKDGGWRYRVHGSDVDGNELRVVVAVNEREVVVVTAFEPDEERDKVNG